MIIDLAACFASANGSGMSFGFALSKRLIESKALYIDASAGKVKCCSEAELFEIIIAEPYPRGEYVARLVASRIHKAIEQINHEGGVCFLEELASAEFERASSMLLPLYGVGPKFVENYCLLAGIETP